MLRLYCRKEGRGKHEPTAGSERIYVIDERVVRLGTQREESIEEPNGLPVCCSGPQKTSTKKRHMNQTKRNETKRKNKNTQLRGAGA